MTNNTLGNLLKKMQPDMFCNYAGDMVPKPKPRAGYHKVSDGHIIELFQFRNTDRYAVRYGLQLDQDLSYAEAARNFGECYMHYLRCEGKLD